VFKSSLAQIGQEFPDQRAVLGGSVPQAQDVLLALFIDSQGDDEAFLAEVLASNQQRHQIGRHRPLNQLLQFGCRRRLPLPAHTGFVDAVVLIHHPLTSVFYFGLFLSSLTRLDYGARR